VGKTKRYRKNMSKFLDFILCICFLVVFIGCGKHEAETGAVGTATGAIVGAAVSGKKDKGTGATVGAFIGNVIGRAIGRQADIQEGEKALTRGEIRHLRAKNRRLRRNKRSEKWCFYCSRKVCLTGANSCPYCGHELMIEKYCRGCDSIFNPESSYKYCPYCTTRVRLSCR